MHEAFGCIMRNFQDVITAHSSEKVVSGVSDLSSLTSIFFFPFSFLLAHVPMPKPPASCISGFCLPRAWSQQCVCPCSFIPSEHKVAIHCLLACLERQLC